jgi:hypothetical protein
MSESLLKNDDRRPTFTETTSDKLKEGYHDTMKNVNKAFGNEEKEQYHKEEADKIKDKVEDNEPPTVIPAKTYGNPPLDSIREPGQDTKNKNFTRKLDTATSLNKENTSTNKV